MIKMSSMLDKTLWRTVLVLGLALLTQTVLSGSSFDELREEDNLVEDVEKRGLSHDSFTNDDIFKELIVKPSSYLASKLPNSSTVLKNAQYGLSQADFLRDKRGAFHLAGIIKCATNCDPLSFKGYGCYCGFLGSGEPVDGIDTCCKMHDWCYTTTACMGIEWQLPYFVPFKWKCNGGSPYCSKTKKSDRNSCSHQLCECDREFAMCLQKYLPCPTTKAMCKSKKRLWQNLLMGVGTGKGVHNPYKSHHHHDHDQSSERYILLDDIHGEPHRFKPKPLINLPQPLLPFKGLRLNFGKKK